MLISTAVIAIAFQVGVPAKVGTLDSSKLKGEPTRLAWSPDGSELALQTSERDSAGMLRNPRGFLLTVADGAIKPASALPAWADEYWTWKSSKYAPWSSTTAIDTRQEQKTVTSTSAPMGGSLAKGGASGEGTSMEEATAAKAQSQTLNVVTLKLMGETVGYFEGMQFIPGYTFGWAPKDLAAVAYVHQSGRLAVMDKDGAKLQVEGTKNVLLPAWSSDGTKIAFLQKAGKNKYEVYVAAVTR